MEAVLIQGLNIYLLIWGRIAGFMLTAVPFSSRAIPVQVKIWLAALIAFLIFMISYRQPVAVSSDLAGYLLQFLTELFTGCAIGFLTQLVFAAIQLAGQLLDTQAGFGVVNVIDPQYGGQVPLLGNFQYILAILLFLVINGHHVLLSCLADSYRLLPVGGGVHLKGPFYSFIFQLAGDMFVTAFRIALPVLGALFIADLVMGVIARTVPQINIFIISIPLKIALGLFVLYLLIPALDWLFRMQFAALFRRLDTLLLLLRG